MSDAMKMMLEKKNEKNSNFVNFDPFLISSLERIGWLPFSSDLICGCNALLSYQEVTLFMSIHPIFKISVIDFCELCSYERATSVKEELAKIAI